jgi:hypothetical protein
MGADNDARCLCSASNGLSQAKALPANDYLILYVFLIDFELLAYLGKPTGIKTKVCAWGWLFNHQHIGLSLVEPARLE